MVFKAVVLVSACAGVVALGCNGQATKREQVESSAVGSDCRVMGGTQHDRAQVLEVCEQTLAAFAELFGRAAPSGLIRLTEKTFTFSNAMTDSGWVFYWPTTDKRIRWSEDADDADLEGTLAHELGHTVTESAFFGTRARALLRALRYKVAGGHTAYATPLPDWLDESLAIHMEPEAKRRYRISLIDTLSLPSLAAIFLEEHPGATPYPDWYERYDTHKLTTSIPGSCRLSEYGQRLLEAGEPLESLCPTEPAIFIGARSGPDGEAVFDTIVLSDAQVDSIRRSPNFYPNSYAALEFIRHAAGDSFFGQLAADLALRPDSLMMPLTRLELRLAVDSSGVELRWRDWVRQNR